MVDATEVQKSRARNELSKLHNDLIVSFEPTQNGSAAVEKSVAASENYSDISVAIQLVSDTLVTLEELRMQNTRQSEELIHLTTENQKLSIVVEDLRGKFKDAEKDNSVLRARNQESERANQQGLVERRKLLEQSNLAEEKLKTVVEAVVKSFQKKSDTKSLPFASLGAAP